VPTPRAESVSILIDGKTIGKWSELEVVNSLDEFSSATLTAPFEANNAAFREIFRPFTYKPLRIFIGDKPLFTGTMLGVQPRVSPERRSVEVTAYALPGVLVKCTPPGESVPHEFKKVTLQEIARSLLDPFGISIDFPNGAGSRFDRVKLEVGKKIIEFLIELAKQRNRVLSNTADGALLCWVSKGSSQPVARLRDGEPPIRVIAGDFSPDEYFSEITGFASAKSGKKGSRYTAQNPFLRDVLRPDSFRLDNTEKGDAPEETLARMGRMFGNMAAYTVEDLPTWRDPKGDLWAPNTSVLVTAPDCMIYRESELLVRRVRFRQSAERQSAELDLVLPGAFSGAVPSRLPWDE
jgi:prophage tail gpP-like protein